MTNGEDGPGYGVDVGYEFKLDGSVDLLIDESGDIRLVGGVEGDSTSLKRENARQQIILRLLTALGVIRTVDGKAVNYGSLLHTAIGFKDTAMNKLMIRAFVIQALFGYEAIEKVVGLGVTVGRSGELVIKLQVSLKNDEEILEEEVTI